MIYQYQGADYRPDRRAKRYIVAGYDLDKVAYELGMQPVEGYYYDSLQELQPEILYSLNGRLFRAFSMEGECYFTCLKKV